MSYLESLMAIRQHGDVDVEKGKQVVSCVQGFSRDKTREEERKKVKQKWTLPAVGTTVPN
jgi:hypothetical protein